MMPLFHPVPRASLAHVCGLIVALCLLPGLAGACPFCEAPTTTLSEQRNSAQVAVLVSWVGVEKPNPATFATGSTTVRVIEVDGDFAGRPERGKDLVLDRYYPGQPGDLFLIFATTEGEKLNWGLPQSLTPLGWKYMIEAPRIGVPTHERLAYFLDFLENRDPDIALDAYGEFARAPYEDLVRIADRLPREAIRGWIVNPNTTPTRLGLFGLMLGLCGQAEDVAFLKELVLQQPADLRVGIDGVMAGYLLLTGEPGLATLTVAKFQNPEAPDHETYAAIQTLRFMWQQGQQKVPPEKLRESLRSLLNHPRLADLVIIDLARWQDWEIMDQLAGQYGLDLYADPHIKQSIVRYLKSAAAETGKEGSPEPAHCVRAKTLLAQLKQSDPETIRYVDRHFFD